MTIELRSAISDHRIAQNVEAVEPMSRPAGGDMPYFQWNDNLFIGVAELDWQHHDLIGMLNKLHESMSRGDGRSIQEELLMRLVKYTQTHFVFEEAVMRKIGYPRLQEQIEEHQALAAEVMEAVDRIHGGQTLVEVGLLPFLRDWLLQHIAKSDRDIGRYVNAKNVA